MEYFESTVTLGVVMEPELSPAEREARLMSINERLRNINYLQRLNVVTDEGSAPRV